MFFYHPGQLARLRRRPFIVPRRLTAVVPYGSRVRFGNMAGLGQNGTDFYSALMTPSYAAPPDTTQASSPSFLQTLSQAAGQIAPVIAQLQLARTNAALIAQGKQPIPASAIAPTVRVAVAPELGKLPLYLLGGAAIIGGAVLLLRRRK